jgi:anaerobic ribonucleoside-triphosphate reductase activating protein
MIKSQDQSDLGLTDDVIELMGPPVMDSIVDGPGIRLAIFVQGCPHRCPGCHNPSSWQSGEGIIFSVKEIIKTMHQEGSFYQGITFSGGEPFLPQHIPALTRLAKEAHKIGWDVWCYSGFLFEDMLKNAQTKKFLKNIDILVDGPFVKEQRSLSLRWKGSANQRTIMVSQSLRTKDIFLFE